MSVSLLFSAQEYQFAVGELHRILLTIPGFEQIQEYPPEGNCGALLDATYRRQSGSYFLCLSLLPHLEVISLSDTEMALEIAILLAGTLPAPQCGYFRIFPSDYTYDQLMLYVGRNDTLRTVTPYGDCTKLSREKNIYPDDSLERLTLSISTDPFAGAIVDSQETSS